MKNRKGIILAGGNGTRLSPVTKSISKQLLPIYNKPMIYYSLSVLMLSNIRDILIISQSNFLPLYKNLFGDGSDLGLNIKYETQNDPNGIPEAFLIGENFIDKDPVALVLGDNIFYGSSLSGQLQQANLNSNASIFCTNVSNKSEFGILEYDDLGNPTKIIEKPINSKSNYAVTGLYFYPNDVIDVTKNLKPSNRGELEITDINNYYIFNKSINIIKLYRGTLWLDAGTFENLHQCSSIIYNLEKNSNIMIGCLEEISLQKKWISAEQCLKLISDLKENEYTSYLKKIVNNYE